MPNDRRMSGDEVDRMLQLATLQAAQEQEHQQDRVRRLQRAMQDPDVVESYKIAGIAVGVDDGKRKLIIATPDGRRREFDLNPQIEKMLLRGLAAPLEEERKAA